MNSTVIQYIDKSKVIAEIERIKKEECPIDTYEGRIKLFYFERFLSFLNTLAVLTLDDIKEMENQAFLHGIDVERNKNIFKDKEIKI